MLVAMVNLYLVNVPHPLMMLVVQRITNRKYQTNKMNISLLLMLSAAETDQSAGGSRQTAVMIALYVVFFFAAAIVVLLVGLALARRCRKKDKQVRCPIYRVVQKSGTPVLILR